MLELMIAFLDQVADLVDKDAGWAYRSCQRRGDMRAAERAYRLLMNCWATETMVRVHFTPAEELVAVTMSWWGTENDEPWLTENSKAKAMEMGLII